MQPFLHSDDEDYEEITSFVNPLVPFTEDSSTHTQCFNVTIFDDEILEDAETFRLNLTLAAGSTYPVIVVPSISQVEIIDNDGMCYIANIAAANNQFMFSTSVLTVGFERILTSVVEDVGSLELCVRVFTEASFLPSHTNINFTLCVDSMEGTAGAANYHLQFVDIFMFICRNSSRFE